MLKDLVSSAMYKLSTCGLNSTVDCPHCSDLNDGWPSDFSIIAKKNSVNQGEYLFSATSGVVASSLSENTKY